MHVDARPAASTPGVLFSRSSRDFANCRVRCASYPFSGGSIPSEMRRAASKRFARHYFRQQQIGRRIGLGGNPNTPTPIDIVGLVGLYGVMSYTVSRRTREIGVRVAFGASAGNIRWLVIREVLIIAAAGVAIGLPVAWWLGRYISTQLYGVKSTDALTMIAATLLLGVVAGLAGLLPSARAARLDPMMALRQE